MSFKRKKCITYVWVFFYTFLSFHPTVKGKDCGRWAHINYNLVILGKFCIAMGGAGEINLMIMHVCVARQQGWVLLKTRSRQWKITEKKTQIKLTRSELRKWAERDGERAKKGIRDTGFAFSRLGINSACSPLQSVARCNLLLSHQKSARSSGCSTGTHRQWL